MPRRSLEYLLAATIVVLVTTIGLLLRSHLKTIDVAMLYLLGVVLVASRYDLGAALLVSLLSIAAFDLIFVPPYYTFGVHDSAYVLTFGVMLVVAVTMSRLTGRVREQAEAAQKREQRTAMMYAMNRELSGAETREARVEIVRRHLGSPVPGEAAIVLVGKGVSADNWPAEGVFADYDVRVAASWAYGHGEPAGWGTAHCADAEALVIPLWTPTARLGVATVRPDRPSDGLEKDDLLLIVGLAEQAAASIERTMLAEEHGRARIEVESERLRSSLLSSLSHDLRTPLGTIEGAASSLLQNADDLPSDLRRELAETVLEESRRMTRLVGNLLDMVRVESGALAVQKAWQPLEEALGVALLRLDGRTDGHPVEAKLPPDLPLVPVDELLIEQVFINLLENAIKYTPPGPIAVGAWLENGQVVVEVADRGAGIPRELEEEVFHKFYRIRQGSEAGSGAGLGLTICRGIIQAHGGRMWVQPRGDGGASFRFTLPLEGPPLGMVPADDEIPERLT